MTSRLGKMIVPVQVGGACRGLELELFESDALTMCQSVIGEEAGNVTAGDYRVPYAAARAITSCMLRRWGAVNAHRCKRGESLLWPTLDSLVAGTETTKGYSTPVSRPLPLNERRRVVRRLGWESVPSEVRAGVLHTLTGKVPLSEPDSGAVHFAAEWLVARKMPANPDWRVVESPAKNVLISDSVGRALGRDPIVTPAAGVSSALLYVLIGVAAKVWML